ncbi:unnamed protein product [Oikopleura dioica]|uniref:ribonuclease H n=1 Tax=Oikopleura dioica TaxID=34765 RepID=E4YPT0_OIKDI|nr:unnamed protein product [Oikopleura dioica]
MYVQNFENLWIDENDYYRDSRNWFICYTDGSCKGNHQHGRRYSGSGIVFGDHPRREISQPCHPKDPSTNQHAELKAALIAIRHARKFNLGRLQIRTDSKFLISIVPHFKNGGNLVPHLAVIIEEIIDLMDFVDVDFIYIPAHINEQGNERADFLAKKAADIHRYYFE